MKMPELSDEGIGEVIRKSPAQWNISHKPIALEIAKAQRELLEKEMASYREVLDCAREAIVGAIYCEDGLDGATGEEVVKWITDVLGDSEEFIKVHTDERWLQEGDEKEQ